VTGLFHTQPSIAEPELCAELFAHFDLRNSQSLRTSVLASQNKETLGHCTCNGALRGGGDGGNSQSGRIRNTATEKKVEDYEFVKVQLGGGVAHMTLNRPDHNLLNESMLREMAEGIEYAGSREDVKIILLDSAHKVFCGGIEIGEYTSQRVFQMLDAFHAAFAAMVDVAKPVICVVNGPAIGGGAELAAFGDLVIATPKARFAQPEITIGMFPPLASTICRIWSVQKSRWNWCLPENR